MHEKDRPNMNISLVQESVYNTEFSRKPFLLVGEKFLRAGKYGEKINIFKVWRKSRGENSICALNVHIYYMLLV